jgi:hypothetical protein
VTVQSSAPVHRKTFFVFINDPWIRSATASRNHGDSQAQYCEGFSHFYPYRPDLVHAVSGPIIECQDILARLYVEALLVNEELADMVWEA